MTEYHKDFELQSDEVKMAIVMVAAGITDYHEEFESSEIVLQDTDQFFERWETKVFMADHRDLEEQEKNQGEAEALSDEWQIQVVSIGDDNVWLLCLKRKEMNHTKRYTDE